MMTIVSVAIGGAVGALGRYLISKWITTGTTFPWATLVVNSLGSIVLGLLVGLLLTWSAPDWLRHGVIVGMLGAFTTFSTFSMETVLLLQQGQARLAFGYVAASLILGIGLAFIGVKLTV